jgi:hypothetical protein
MVKLGDHIKADMKAAADANKEIVDAEVIVEGMFGDTRVMVKYAEEGEFEKLFSFYPDEISFSKSEIIGKTVAEAKRLKFEKDRAYLRS